MTVLVEYVPEVAEGRLGVCHVAISPIHKNVALCGVMIPDEPWCCGSDRGSCGRPKCDACLQVAREP